jgi:uncharacterized membrane protein YfcA
MLAGIPENWSPEQDYQNIAMYLVVATALVVVAMLAWWKSKPVDRPRALVIVFFCTMGALYFFWAAWVSFQRGETRAQSTRPIDN